jgi:hypothetical protein
MQHKQPATTGPGEQIPLRHLLSETVPTEPNIWLRRMDRPDYPDLCLFSPPAPKQKPGIPTPAFPPYSAQRTTDNILPRYLAYQLQVPALVRWRETVTAGTRGWWWEALGTQKIFVPSLEDQQKTIDTLLRLEEKVAKLRENHRRTMQLLQEMQESILVRAVYCLPMGGEVKV